MRQILKDRIGRFMCKSFHGRRINAESWSERTSLFHQNSHIIIGSVNWRCLWNKIKLVIVQVLLSRQSFKETLKKLKVYLICCLLGHRKMSFTTLHPLYRTGRKYIYCYMFLWSESWSHHFRFNGRSEYRSLDIILMSVLKVDISKIYYSVSTQTRTYFYKLGS